MDLSMLTDRVTNSIVKVFVTNAFSLNMLEGEFLELGFIRLEKDLAKEIVKSPSIKSYVGHADTAAVMSSDLGVEIQFNRETLNLTFKDQVLLVGQYRGPRLEEGAKTLPEGALLEWWLVHPSLK